MTDTYVMRPEMFPGSVFEPVTGSTRGKWRCKVCGRTGYPSSGAYTPGWMANCLRGHAPCPKCGHMLTVLEGGRPRTHGRCPGPGIPVC